MPEIKKEKVRPPFNGDLPRWLITIKTETGTVEEQFYKKDGVYCNDHNTRTFKTQQAIIEYLSNNFA